jgi:hypothetical protein
MKRLHFLLALLLGTVAAGAIAYGTAPLTTTVQNYGNEGYLLAGDTASVIPSFAEIYQGAPVYVWAASTTDTRALQRPLNSADRFAATWVDDDRTYVTVDIKDSQLHRVSLYFLDWDRLGRSERVDVIDAVTGQVLDSRIISNFGDGVYGAWNIQGRVLFSITNITGNAVVSGVFIDPVSTVTPSPTPEPTPSPSATPTPTPTATPTPTPAPSPTPSPCPGKVLPNGKCKKN